ncbi:MAG: translation initiation factor IF-1 [Verrucomicrobiae bacterium]|nr:translation initiation factor IF-1 [Verrucomicrobiae bacterium]
MPGTDHIEVIGTVVEALPRSAFRVALPNGHRLVARTAGRLRLSPAKLLPGSRVRLQMSAFDLSGARIVGVEK